MVVVVVGDTGLERHIPEEEAIRIPEEGVIHSLEEEVIHSLEVEAIHILGVDTGLVVDIGLAGRRILVEDQSSLGEGHHNLGLAAVEDKETDQAALGLQNKYSDYCSTSRQLLCFP
jgi:hypothetical protein